MTNLELTQEIFVRFGNHDVDGIMELLAENAIIDFYGPSTIPYAGHYDGKGECRSFFETVLSSVDIHVFEADDFVCQDNKVVVFGHLRLTAKSTGREIVSDFVHFIECENGKWSHFRDFMNTAVAVEAFR
jgi:uncharacterized protein